MNNTEGLAYEEEGFFKWWVVGGVEGLGGSFCYYNHVEHNISQFFTYFSGELKRKLNLIDDNTYVI